MIETGRHQHIEKCYRFCPFCPKEVEDEFHFMLECQTFRTLKDELSNQVLTEVGNLAQLEKLDRFIILLC